jgi:polysaccharide chain length determinant protein (PEP-CTERM system associated)
MRLEKILNEFDPYADLRHKLTRGMMVDKLRHDLDVVVKGSDAFALGFVHRNPEVAANVVNRLSTLFVDESNQAREAQMEGAAEFIDAQLEDARRQLEAKELDLRRYKEAHVGKLPEHSQANMGTLQRLQLESESLAESLRTARERQLLLERAAMTPGAPLPQAPAAAAETSAELGQLRAQLAALRSRSTDEHPDVQALTDRIALLQKRQDVTSPATSAGPGAASESTPSLARLQLEQVRLEIADLEAKRSEMDRRMAFFQRRIDDTPQTEQELATLTRDYQKLSENYLGFLKKKFDTQVAERLERRWRTAHFRVLDPAYPPEKPSFPKPWLFILLGAVLGLGSGVGVSLLAELLDHSIKGLRELEAVLPYPVLAAFPHVTPFKRPRP